MVSLKGVRQVSVVVHPTSKQFVLVTAPDDRVIDRKAADETLLSFIQRIYALVYREEVELRVDPLFLRTLPFEIEKWSLWPLTVYPHSVAAHDTGRNTAYYAHPVHGHKSIHQTGGGTYYYQTERKEKVRGELDVVVDAVEQDILVNRIRAYLVEHQTRR